MFFINQKLTDQKNQFEEAKIRLILKTYQINCERERVI